MYRAYVKSFSTMAAQKLKLVVFIGSTREGRFGERVGKFVTDTLKSENKYDIDVLDPVEQEYPLLKKPLHFYKDRAEAPKFLVEANEKIKAADAFLLISCEYNHCIPPALSNMLDHFPGSSFSWRPSGIITYSPGIYGGMRAAMLLRAMTGEISSISVSNLFGILQVHKAIDESGKLLNGIYGGMRAAMQLRAMTGELGCISVSNIFGIPQVHKAIDESGKPLDDHMNSGLKKLMTQLDWTAIAMKNMRDTNGIPS